jgi:hypothetical protein
MSTLPHSYFKKGIVSTQSAHTSVAIFWGFDSRKGKQQVLHDSNYKRIKCLINGISILHPFMPMTTTAEAHYTNRSSVNIVKKMLKFSALSHNHNSMSCDSEIHVYRKNIILPKQTCEGIVTKSGLLNWNQDI